MIGENEIVSTGTLISCGDDEAYVVIKGDTNGDGIVDSTDSRFFYEKFQVYLWKIINTYWKWYEEWY